MNGDRSDGSAVPVVLVVLALGGVAVLVVFGVVGWLMFSLSPAPMPAVQRVPPSTTVPTAAAEQFTVVLEESVPAEASKDDEALAVAYKEVDAGAAEIMALKAQIAACDEANKALEDRIQALEKEVAGLKQQLVEIREPSKK